MEYQTEYANVHRGGIAVRDYTQTTLPPALTNRFSLQRLQSGSKAFNFSKLVRPLIFASLGLGLVELLLPRTFLKMIGVRDTKYSTLVRLLGARELSAGMLIYSQARPFTGTLARVVGDVIDLGLLAAAFTTRRANKRNLAITTAAIAGITAVDVLAAQKINAARAEAARISDFTQADMDERRPDGAFRVTRSITINRPADALYAYWHDFANLPNFMYHLERVTVLDANRSHWVAKAPAGTSVEWEAQIIDDQPNERIAWRSIPGADVENSGEVRFEPVAAGTEVRVQIDYHLPAGILGKIVAKLFGEDPGQQVSDDLRRFKQVIETGEILISDGSQAGSGQKLQRSARPLRQKRASEKNKDAGKLTDYAKRGQQPVEASREPVGE